MWCRTLRTNRANARLSLRNATPRDRVAPPMMRVLSSIAVVVMLLAGGCKSEPKPAAVSITFWHTFNAAETEVINERIAAFEEAHPDIDVQVSVLPFGSAQSRIKDAYARGEAPDLFRMETAWTSEYMEQGILRPADTWMSPAEIDDLLPDARALFTADDRLWAAPQVIDGLALLYNRKLLASTHQKVPTTVDELRVVAAKLVDVPSGRHGFFVRGDGYWFLPFLWGYGGELVTPDGRIGVDTPEGREALRAYVSLSSVSMAPRRTDWAREYRRMMRLFGEGRVAMMLNGPWAVSEILGGPAFAADPANLGIAAVPAGPAGAVTPIGGHAYGISSSSRHGQAAAALARWLYDTDTQRALALRAHVLPTRRSAYSPEVSTDPVIMQFQTALAAGRVRAQTPEMAFGLGTLSSGVQAALEGDMSAERAVAAVAKQWRDQVAREEGATP